MKKIISLVLLLLVFLPGARAQDFVLERQAEDFSLILEEVPSVNFWKLEVVRFRMVLELGVEIPLISKFSLNPEVELHFIKK